MNAKVVYQVAKALSNEELDELFDMLQADKTTNYIPPHNFKKQKIISNDKAIKYLLNTVFSKRNYELNIKRT